MKRRAYLRTAAGVSVLGLAGCSNQTVAVDGENEVGMSTDSFRPVTLDVEAGDTVVWTNTSKQGHSVTAYESELPDGAEYFASGEFASESAARNGWPGEGRLAKGDTFEHTFEVPGEYPYFCIPHERIGMKGTIVVTEAATESSTAGTETGTTGTETGTAGSDA